MYEAFNPRAINGTPFPDVPAGYRIIVVEDSRLPGFGYRWQRTADGWTSIAYPTQERACNGARADSVYQRTSKQG